MMKSKQQLRARHSAIVNQLSQMSRDGWRNVSPLDYMPLERELALIEQQLEHRAASDARLYVDGLKLFTKKGAE
jgi:hypothetical protein